MKIESILGQLRATANACPHLTRVGRHCNVEFLTTSCPVFLMTGEYDYSCTPELTSETAARIPGAEAIIMDGIGHFPMSENPERFSVFLLPVLDRILMV